MNLIGQPSIGLGIDPHASRLIEETAAIVNDVDQRLTALKVGLSQAMPHLSGILLWKEQLAMTNPLARAGSPFAAIPGIERASLGVPITPPGLYGNALFPFVPSPTGLGVTNPFGIASPFRIF